MYRGKSETGFLNILNSNVYGECVYCNMKATSNNVNVADQPTHMRRLISAVVVRVLLLTWSKVICIVCVNNIYKR